MVIRQSVDSEIEEVLRVEREAFGYPKEAELVGELLADPSAQPLYSLLAWDGDEAAGHILFTKANLEGAEPQPSVYLLAPLAVLPGCQNQGLGGKLIGHGLELLKEAGVELVFVLGHPGYYPRHGFAPAGVHGLDAPYPIPPEHADAWMVQELRPGVIGTVRGTVRCARALDRPEHWRE
ncbi:MAG: N-acetyltransferase [Desulfarculaceae bacterium]|nr:N-acetyltransferase [Desulfarculaceae bacterium]MCF8072964.1 N-acetyltransferase [Desulfarculaceae bacterium]MCF8100740.1 N-acetyltransferase [Desulfarculaceae bacterium]MCF8115478.1 N-acetyltransferase [Desulfarculaceae bacterium]